MQALILAGGLGTRLRSIVADRPKPMVDVGGKPFLAYQLEFLRSHQIAHLILCVGHLHEKIQEYFGHGENWGVKIDYAIEEELLGTGGALKNAEKYLNGTFLVLNGDSYFDIDLSKLVQFHNDKKNKSQSCLGAIALTEVRDARSFGSISLDAENKILSFQEKIAGSNCSTHINAGIYILEPALVNFIPPSQKVSLERETFPMILEKGNLLFGCPSKGFFVDIGTPEGYHLFQRYIRNTG
jgi:NDP-sugar pyrophosphorylase family protein